MHTWFEGGEAGATLRWFTASSTRHASPAPKKTPPRRGKYGTTSSEGPVEPVPTGGNSSPGPWFRSLTNISR
jgi:hypothetical protein